MKRSLVLWQFGGLTFTAVLGTILHFLYDWTGLIIFAPISIGARKKQFIRKQAQYDQGLFA
jgi:hypothetical protein